MIVTDFIGKQCRKITILANTQYKTLNLHKLKRWTLDYKLLKGY